MTSPICDPSCQNVYLDWQVFTSDVVESSLSESKSSLSKSESESSPPESKSESSLSESESSSPYGN